MTRQEPAATAGRREYPDALKFAERVWIDARRKAVNDAGGARIPEGAPAVGLALSGGGIRSATFGFGVIQALIKHGLLRRIDFLSTVSGGGYIGGFLGRLYSRHYASPAVVEYLLHPERGGEPKPEWANKAATDDERKANLDKVDPFHWLRENGRYLAPNGTGDIVLAFAVAIRNWIALQLVFASFLLVPLLFAQLVRRFVEWSPLGTWLANTPAGLSMWLNDGNVGLFQWSPFIDLAPVLLLLWVIPVGWSYWLIDDIHRKQVHPLYGVALLVLLSSVALLYPGIGLAFPGSQPMFALLLLSSVLGFAVSAIARSLSGSSAMLTAKDLDADKLSRARSLVTRWLSSAIAVTLGLIAFAVIDTLGQSVYWHFSDDQGGSVAWMVAMATASTPIVLRLMRLPALLTSMAGGGAARVLKLPVELVAALLALALALILFVGLDAFAHAMVNGFRPHGEAPPMPRLALIGFGLLLMFAMLFGWTWPFLNQSSQSSLYRSRLSRAYLGASNWRRFRNTRMASVTDTIAGDDLRAEEYWRQVVDHGGPLHLVNVTVNETAGDEVRTVLRDRKGMPLAAGPCGYSAGARHHALRMGDAASAALGLATGSPTIGPQRKPTSTRREPVLALRGRIGYSMFYRRENVEAEDAVTIAVPNPEKACVAALEEVEKLSIGHWIAISGAAFTTGLGSRTTIGLSFLLGFANIRLGYWWDAGDRLDPPKTLRGVLGLALRTLFPIQCYLIDEFTARFRGAGTRRWYLSDGGHFENMGAYELIRRRVPMIVIVDGEEDTEYSYEGLANLVRKARLDFDAEICFLDGDELAACLHPEILPLFGSLDSLRPVGAGGFSPKHAALARVRYIGSSQEESLIIYLKATLSADNPADVREYRTKNPDFPQQSTLNQFFDESQWESYRKLGEVIATDVFAKPRAGGSWFSPNSLWPVFKAGGVSAGSAGTSSLRDSPTAPP